jgi:trimethylamine-N-oxide reductase cytochrome c-type subunit TorC
MDSRMKNPLAKLRPFLRRPKTFAIGGVALIVIGSVAFGAVGFIGFHKALELTTTTEFCVSCHSMADNNFVEYKKTIHYKNPAGVRAGCPDCHVPKEGFQLYKAKLFAAKDLWGEITGTIDTREKFESARLRMATTVWDTMKANDSAQCRSCHSFEAMDFDHQKPKASKMMQKASLEGGTCIDCHKGIAHQLPDMSSGYKSLFSTIVANSKDKQSGKLLYAVKSAKLYAARPADDSGKGDGNIMPLTAVKVLEKDGDWIRIGIDGWFQEGMERVLVKEMGRRIFLATLSGDMVKDVVIKNARTDDETGLNWKEGDIEAWAKIDTFTSDNDGLLGYGKEMYAAACGACHSPPASDHFLANQWAGIVKDMKGNTALDTEEVRFLQNYLQLHAKDMPKS